MKLSELFQKIGFWVATVTIFLIPLFFLPFTSDFYDFNKQALLVTASLILLALLTASFIADKQVRITRSPFGIPLIAMAASWLVSSLIKTPNRVDAFLDPGNTTTILALVIFFFSSLSLIRSKHEVETMVKSLVASVFILTLATLVWTSGIGEKIFPIPFLKSPFFTPTGNSVITLSILLGSIPFLGVTIAKTREQSSKTLTLAVTLFLCVIGSAMIGYRVFRPSSSVTQSPTPVFLPQNISWAVALESLKTSPLLGTGPATYLSVFSLYRPLSYNVTPLWNLRFSTASNYYLHLLTVVGLLGLLSYVFLALRSFSTFLRVFRSSSDSPLHTISLASFSAASLLFVSQLAVPTTVTSLAFTTFLLLIGALALKASGSSLVHEANIDIVASNETGNKSPLLPTISFIFALALLLPTLYLGGRAYLAENTFFVATQAAAANDGKKTYDTLISAIRTNPFKDTYRLAYAQTNLLLADSIANKKDLTDQDRNLIAQLIQQAIREAKNAVALNPSKAANVENLAITYRNLLGVAEGAESWALASYRQAITLDPTNPNLRIAMGGIFYALKNYDEAARTFQSAIDLKPDLPNAHYNLAAAYREQGSYSQAYSSLQNTLSLVDRASADYAKVQTELDDLRKKLGEASSTTPAAAPAKSELESPQPLPTPKISPPIQLPSELGPETSPAPQP